MKKVLLLLLICVFLITGCSVKKTNQMTDSEIFAAEYAIGKDNMFKYATIEEVFTLLEKDTGIIFFGNSDQECCLEAVELFSKLAATHQINEVYYYNPTVIKDNLTDEYYTLVDLLGYNLLPETTEDNYLNMPAIYFVKDGEIIGYNDDALQLMETFDDDLEKFKENLEVEYLKLIEEYKTKTTQ